MPRRRLRDGYIARRPKRSAVVGVDRRGRRYLLGDADRDARVRQRALDLADVQERVSVHAVGHLRGDATRSSASGLPTRRAMNRYTAGKCSRNTASKSPRAATAPVAWFPSTSKY
jgi:hypothetical protein